MCIFKYSGFGDSEKEHVLTIKILSGNISIIYDDEKKCEDLFSISEFSQLSKDYNENYVSGVTFLNRNIFKNKEISNLFLPQEKFFELFRVFLRHTSLIFNYYKNDDDLLKRINSLYEEEQRNIFFDFLHIDWSGDMNVQPQFYFVEKNLNAKHLKKLYRASFKSRYKG